MTYRADLLMVLDRLNRRLRAHHADAAVIVDMDDAQDMSDHELRSVIESTRHKLMVLGEQ